MESEVMNIRDRGTLEALAQNPLLNISVTVLDPIVYSNTGTHDHDDTLRQSKLASEGLIPEEGMACFLGVTFKYGRIFGDSITQWFLMEPTSSKYVTKVFDIPLLTKFLMTGRAIQRPGRVAVQQ
jgi:hypothetical protein